MPRRNSNALAHRTRNRSTRGQVIPVVHPTSGNITFATLGRTDRHGITTARLDDGTTIHFEL